MTDYERGWRDAVGAAARLMAKPKRPGHAESERQASQRMKKIIALLAPLTHYCNKCGYAGPSEIHEGCNYSAAVVFHDEVLAATPLDDKAHHPDEDAGRCRCGRMFLDAAVISHMVLDGTRHTREHCETVSNHLHGCDWPRGPCSCPAHTDLDRDDARPQRQRGRRAREGGR